MKQIKQNHSPTPPRDAFFPVLLATVCMGVSLVALLIDRFVYPFGGDLLSPMLAEIMILLIPTYLCMLFLSPEKSLFSRFQSVGIARLKADYIFFLIFAAMFTVVTSFLLNLLFGGVNDASDGFTLLGAFTAGANEYTVSYPYLILVYALVPAIAEELVFRGFIYSELKRVNPSVAIVLSSLVAALFAFTLGGIPSALFCGLIYCFILHTTGALQACMIVHFVYNLYGIFVQTNLSKYFLSSQNNTLLLIVCALAWLISASLFFAESARLYTAKAKRITAEKGRSELPDPNHRAWFPCLKSIFSFKPTLICGIVTVALYAIAMLIIILN